MRTVTTDDNVDSDNATDDDNKDVGGDDKPPKSPYSGNRDDILVCIS